MSVKIDLSKTNSGGKYDGLEGAAADEAGAGGEGDEGEGDEEEAGEGGEEKMLPTCSMLLKREEEDLAEVFNVERNSL